jgi:hypothetical protein
MQEHFVGLDVRKHVIAYWIKKVDGTAGGSQGV